MRLRVHHRKPAHPWPANAPAYRSLRLWPGACAEGQQDFFSLHLKKAISYQSITAEQIEIHG